MTRSLLLRFIFIALVLTLAFGACSKDDELLPIAPQTVSKDSHSNALMKAAPDAFGAWSLGIHPEDNNPFPPEKPREWQTNPHIIAQYGPHVKGWRGVVLNGRQNYPHRQEDFQDAANANYEYVIVQLSREKIQWGQFGRVQEELDLQRYGVTVKWFLVDDALNNDTRNGYTQISLSQITQVASDVHRRGDKLAVSIACSHMVKWGAPPGWFDNVDMIMPYQYDCTVSDYQAWLSWLKSYPPTSSKPLVPILGYNCYVEKPGEAQCGGHDYYQKGLRVNGASGFIEAAGAVADRGLVFYYWEGGNHFGGGGCYPTTFDWSCLESYLPDLTEMLQQCQYMTRN
jgi:hypothetical protein